MTIGTNRNHVISHPKNLGGFQAKENGYNSCDHAIMAPRYNQVDGDEDGWRQDVDTLEETLGNLGLEERVRRQI